MRDEEDPTRMTVRAPKALADFQIVFVAWKQHNRSEQGGAAFIHLGSPAFHLPCRELDMEQPTVLSLREMVGTLIVARIPALDKENNVFVLLHWVEMSGIWVESKTFNQEMLEKYEIPASITTLLNARQLWATPA